MKRRVQDMTPYSVPSRRGVDGRGDQVGADPWAEEAALWLLCPRGRGHLDLNSEEAHLKMYSLGRHSCGDTCWAGCGVTGLAWSPNGCKFGSFIPLPFTKRSRSPDHPN